MIFNPVRYGGGSRKVYTREGQREKITSSFYLQTDSITLTFDEPVQAFSYWGDGYYRKASTSSDFKYNDVSACLFGPITDPNLATEFYPCVLAGRSGDSIIALDKTFSAEWADDKKSVTITVPKSENLVNYFDLSGNTYHYIGIPADS